MKKYIYTTLIAMAGAAAMNAQTAYDAEIMTTADLNGTARYVGMGGALGALGADLSTMGSNPAGTALMRTSDVSFTVGGLFTGNSGTLGQDAGKASIDQAGILFALGGGGSSLKNINFGVNYQKKRNFLSNLSTDVFLNGGSQTFQIAEMANEAFLNYDKVKNPNPFGILTYGAIPYSSIKCMEKNGQSVTEAETKSWPAWYTTDRLVNFDYIDPTGSGKYIGKYSGVDASSAGYRRISSGSSAQVDMNLSFNVEDKLFLGLSVGVYSMSYDRQAAYTETGTDNSTYIINNWYHNSADGVDVKFGAIFRPIEDSPFRFGVSVHTPIWYNLKDYNTFNISGFYDYTIDIASRNYNFRTPWKFGLSLGHTVGNMLAIGLEYEFQDFGSCKYYETSSNNYFNAGANENIKANLRGTHTVKIGAELKPAPEWAIRLGYNLVTAPLKKQAYQYLDYWNDEFSETDYTNWGAINRITFGLGYRFKGGYFDLAYQLQLQKGDFYAYGYPGVEHKNVGLNYNPSIAPTQITNNRSHVMATLGFKF